MCTVVCCRQRFLKSLYLKKFQIKFRFKNTCKISKYYFEKSYAYISLFTKCSFKLIEIRIENLFFNKALDRLIKIALHFFCLILVVFYLFLDRKINLYILIFQYTFITHRFISVYKCVYLSLLTF